MGRAKAQPKPEAVILPPDLEEEDDDQAGGGIPDDDGWIHLKGKEPTNVEEKPKRRSRRRSD